MLIRRVPITKIKPAPYNPRVDLKPGDPEYDKLARSMDEFGSVQPPVWNKRTGHVVGGHQRLKVLLDRGEKTVDVVVVDLPLEKEKLLNLALNQISGDWDEQKLAVLLDELVKCPTVDIELSGFNLPEARDLIGRLLDTAPADAVVLDNFDEESALAASAKGPTITKPGDLIVLGRDRLFGTRASRARSLTIDLQSLEALLREGELAPSLRDALESLGGPISDLRARDAALQDRWNEVFTQCRLRVGTSPALNAWVDGIHSTGLLRRLSCQDPNRGQCLAEAATTVVSRLPQNLVPLAVFAAATVGDSHALDRRTPLGLLCVHAAAHLAGRELPRTPRARRDTWAAVGVVCDDLSAPVLTLNLPLGPPGCALDLASRAHAAEGEPYRVSLRQLVRHRLVLCPTAPPTVFVCENPAVVASAASILGAGCAPMLCLEGRPRSASLVLLSALRDAGVELRYHGDFDWPGVQITVAMIADFGAKPWRMSAVDYEGHVRQGSTLRGRSVETPWDDRLSIDMMAAKRAVHEELVLADLLQDLAPTMRLPR